MTRVRTCAGTGVRFAALLLVLACARTPAPPPPTETAPAPPARPAVAGPRVILPDGFSIGVEIAADQELRAQGMMFRDQLPRGRGMLFFFPENGVYPFWMKNTRIPLDMIWIDESLRVVHVKHHVPPCRVEDCPSYDPQVEARYVLELAGGEAEVLGIAVGDSLRFEDMEAVVAR